MTNYQMEAGAMTRRTFMRVALAAGAGAAAFALGGCSGAGETSSASSASSAAKEASPAVVVDAKGREVAVPEHIERIGVTCCGGALQTMVVLGGADRVVVAPSPSKNSPLLLKMSPGLEGVPDAGTFDDVNIETLAAADPDFVFVASTSDKGNAQIEDVGIPTYTLSTANASPESLRQEYQNVGVLLGTQDISADLVEFWDDIMGRVEEGTSRIAEADKLKVYRCGAAITKASHTPWAANWIRTAGGISVAEDGTTGDVSIEKVAAWNPDVISTSGDVAAILMDPSLQDITAVKNGAVCKSPKGAMGWDAPSPEVPLGFAWLAKTLYPQVFSSIDIKEETQRFYRDFYKYELSEEEYDAFFV